LKLLVIGKPTVLEMSRPARGAWIETRMAWCIFFSCMSRPARGAWIETVSLPLCRQYIAVAPRAGRVD